MVDVEIRGRLGQYIKGVLLNVEDGNATIALTTSGAEKNEHEQVPLNRVRLPPTTFNSRDIRPGQLAEVLFNVGDSQSADQLGDNGAAILANWSDESPDTSDIPVNNSHTDHLNTPAWWPCRVQKVRDEVAAIRLHVNPPTDASSSDLTLCTYLSAVTDIVRRSVLRPPSENSPFLTPDLIHRHTIKIPKELSEFASDTSVHAEFLRHCGGPTSTFFEPDSCSLIVLSTDMSTVRNVALLEETHLKMLRQKWAITRSLRQTIRNLEDQSSDRHHTGSAHSKGGGDWSTDSSLFVEKFYVPRYLMGLAIGAKGANIRAAREIPGVVFIRLREPEEMAVRRNGDPTLDGSLDHPDATLFVVEARTAEAAKEARSRLEFTQLYLGAPRRYVGRLIGRQTSNILSIIEKSGVVHIHFDDHCAGLDGEDLPNMELLKLNPSAAQPLKRVFLNAGGTQSSEPEVDEEYGGFLLAGTRESIERARLLISFQLDYICDLEKMEAEKVELMRSLGHGDVGLSFHPSRGPPGDSYFPNRQVERGLGGRGGRRPPSHRGRPFHPSLLGAYPGNPQLDPSQPSTSNAVAQDHLSGRRPGRGLRSFNGEGRPRRSMGRGGTGRKGPTDTRDGLGSNGDTLDVNIDSADSDNLVTSSTRGREGPSGSAGRDREQDSYLGGDRFASMKGHGYDEQPSTNSRRRGTDRPGRNRTGPVLHAGVEDSQRLIRRPPAVVASPSSSNHASTRSPQGPQNGLTE